MNFKIFFLILTLFVTSGCVSNQIQFYDDTYSDELDNVLDDFVDDCNELAKSLDNTIFDNDNPPNNFVIGGFEGVIGGTLIDVSNDTFIRGYNGYLLTFRGVEKEGVLSFGTVSEEYFNYEIGVFYKFDLANKNNSSAAIHGAFIDNDFDKLEEINCFE